MKLKKRMGLIEVKIRYKNKDWNAELLAKHFGCSVDIAKFIFNRLVEKKVSVDAVFCDAKNVKNCNIYKTPTGAKINTAKLSRIVGITRDTSSRRIIRIIAGEININELFAPPFRRVDGNGIIMKRSSLIYRGKKYTLPDIQLFFGCGYETAKNLRARFFKGHFDAKDLFEYHPVETNSNTKVRNTYTDNLGNVFDCHKIMKLTGFKTTKARSKIADIVAGESTIDDLLEVVTDNVKKMSPGRAVKCGFRDIMSAERRAAMRELDEEWRSLQEVGRLKDEKYFGHIKPKEYKKWERVAR